MVSHEQSNKQELEDLLGGRVLAWVGGGSVVAGLALLMALGISQGWIGESARTALAACVSLTLLGAGAWLQERRGQVQAARAAAATGICGLFMTATVASAVYHLLPTVAGLALAFVTGAAAVVLALRWSSPLMAGLGVAGAVFAPVLVGAPGTTTTMAFEAIAVASAVGVLLHARWQWLMITVVALSAPQLFVWMSQAQSATEVIVVPFVFGLLYAAAALGFEMRVPSERLRVAPSLVLTFSALALGVAGWFRLKALGHHDLGLMWLTLLASSHLIAGLTARRSTRIAPDIGLLCLTLAVLLADAGFALAFDGPARGAGFAVGAVLFAVLARRHGNQHEGLLSQYGLGGHIAISALQALHEVSAARGSGPGSTAAAVAALVAVAVGCLMSARLAEGGNEESRVALDVTGLLALFGIAMLTLDGAALTAAWAGQSAALAKIGARRDDDVARFAAVVHLLAAAVWALFDQAPPDALISGAGDLGAAVAGGGAVAVATWVCARAFGSSDAVGRRLMLAFPVVALYAASVAVVTLSPAPLDGGAVQQGQLQLSALWSVAGVAGLILGLRRGSQTLRLGAFGLLGLAAGKVFLYDLAALTSVYRVGSFLALGLLLLVAALAYQRMRPQVMA